MVSSPCARLKRLRKARSSTMAEWNAYYQNKEEEEEGEQEEGEQLGGKLANLIFSLSAISPVLIIFSHQSGSV